jgi:mono/diheme cytochrome c family protein
VRRAAVLLLSVLAAACGADPLRHPPATNAGALASAHGADAAPVDPLLANDCLACHSLDLIGQQRLSDKQWPKTLDKMRGWGAPTEDDGVPAMLATLASAAAGDTVTRTIAADEAAALFAVLPDGALAGGDAARGRTLYADRCEPCHAEDGRGSRLGVALAGRHVLDRPYDVAAVVRAGRGRMPDYAEATDAQIADVLAYLRSLPVP